MEHVAGAGGGLMVPEGGSPLDIAAPRQPAALPPPAEDPGSDSEILLEYE
ncbi:hypothetical protein GCM10010387_04430 [Streptomyces inusitatus]|uniref:Uncharacterized protein n=1 Tax=Streptomyces inusitatus TaxID=68221 RepID=A0A918PNR7_9ACTN|nr:hypothetical protein [Streptomyces inusitatus]GGZ15241.1 hypothetical protein GCM10010387_04430 [Streptomyces inusitatus]